jgi:hypothetical protein
MFLLDDPDAVHGRDQLAKRLVDCTRVARVAAIPVRGEDGEVRVDRLSELRAVVATERLSPPDRREAAILAANGTRLPAGDLRPRASGAERAEHGIPVACDEAIV